MRHRLRLSISFIFEDLRIWPDRYPDVLASAAEAYDNHRLCYPKTHWANTQQNVAFLNIFKSVRMCVSDYEEGTYEVAMAGDFNR